MEGIKLISKYYKVDRRKMCHGSLAIYSHTQCLHTNLYIQCTKPKLKRKGTCTQGLCPTAAQALLHPPNICRHSLTGLWSTVPLCQEKQHWQMQPASPPSTRSVRVRA